jgi:hypothetical protein
MAIGITGHMRPGLGTGDQAARTLRPRLVCPTSIIRQLIGQ